MDRPLPRPTAFTNASSATSTAVVVWQAEEQWRCIKMTAQQPEVAALILACGLFIKEHLNVVTDSVFVTKLSLAMSRPGVSTSATVAKIEEALYSREGTILVIHINSHDPIKGFFQIGNDRVDAAAKGLWTLRDAHQLHETLHIGAKALAKKCGIPIADAKHVVATVHIVKRPHYGPVAISFPGDIL